MFFTLGLTADFASAHRHEFSSPQTPPQQQRTSPRPRPFYSFALPYSEVEAEEPSSSEPAPVPSAVPLDEVRTEPEPAMVAEAIDESSSENGLTRSNSTASVTTAQRRGKSTPRTRTLFQLAHPPPVISRPRLVIRPRLLLQVQKLSASARSVPAYDILPSSTTFLPRLSRRFPRFFTNKDGLGPNDLLVVTSEDYASSSTTPGREDSGESSEDDGIGSRQVVSAIRQVKKGEGGASGKVEICLGRGPVWEATPLANGGYELVARDENGLTTTKARWVQRKPANRRRTSHQQTPTSPVYPDDDEKKFIFSIMSPNTRRHPIIATMTRRIIDIPDHYSLGSLSSGPQPPTSPSKTPLSMDSARTSYFDPPDRNLVKTDDLLKTLIIVSGVWVAFREGWSQNFQYHDTASSPATSSPGSPTNSRSARSLSNEQRRTENGHRSTTDDVDHSHHNSLQSVGGRILRTGNHLLHRSSATHPSSVSEVTADFPPPRRANSTGTAFLQRGHTRNRSNSGRASNAFYNTPLGESEGEYDTSIPTPSAPTPTRSRRPTSLVVNGSHGSEYSTLSISTAGQTSLQTASSNGARSGRATQSAYLPRAPDMMDGAGGTKPPPPRKTQKTSRKEGEKKRWGMKGLFSMIRRSNNG